MTRSISATLRAAVNAQQTGEIFLCLIDLYHADIDTGDNYLRFVNNSADIVSQGETYTAFPFEITLPADADDELPRVRLSICNVDRLIIEAVRGLTGPPDVTLTIVLADSPDTVEAEFEFTLRNVDYDAMTVSGDLQTLDILNEPYPGPAYTPQNFPGLF